VGSDWVQRGAVLKASDYSTVDSFGTSVALSSDGTVLVVGAYAWEDTNTDPTGSSDNYGGVYTYDLVGSDWVQRGVVLKASDYSTGDGFGRSVALSSDGTVLAVGSSTWEDTNTNPTGNSDNYGGVYVYQLTHDHNSKEIAFHSDVPTAVDNWANYHEGTAPSYFAGDILVGTTTNNGSGAKLQVSGDISLTGTVLGDVQYDGTTSGLAATDMQGAIDEVVAERNLFLVQTTYNNIHSAVHVAGTATGNIDTYSNYVKLSIQSDVTNTYTSYQSYIGTNTGTALTHLRHFVSGQNTFSGTSVTYQYGFLAENTLIGATNNYGFYGNIPNGTNRWNFYAGTNALNYFKGITIIGDSPVDNGTGAKLQVSGHISLTGKIVVAGFNEIISSYPTFTTDNTAKVQDITCNVSKHKFTYDVPTVGNTLKFNLTNVPAAGTAIEIAIIFTIDTVAPTALSFQVEGVDKASNTIFYPGGTAPTLDVSSRRRLVIFTEDGGATLDVVYTQPMANA
jgi:hypothetical protein